LSWLRVHLEPGQPFNLYLVTDLEVAGMFFVYSIYDMEGLVRRSARVALLILALFIAQLSYAGDVVYTMWEDDGGKFWVRIENDTERNIVVESILIVFYNEKGKPVDQRNVPCKGNCRISSRDTRDFGPHDAPAQTESARVRNVKYSVE